MKTMMKPEKMKMLAAVSGLLGALLRWLLYETGTDEKGLLVTGHWTAIALWVLTAVYCGAVLLYCRKLTGPGQYRHCYPASAAAALGCIACGAALALAGMKDWPLAEAPMDMLSAALSLAAAAALVVIALCRLLGKMPPFPLHALVCLCLALRMVSRYRAWSSEPQLMDYLFFVLGYVTLTLSSYQLAAFDAGMGSHRKLWCFGLMAVYFCLTGLYRCGEVPVMAGCALWMLLNLPSLRARRERPVLDLETPEPGEG